MNNTRVVHISIYPEQGKLYTKKSGVASYLKNLLTASSHESVHMSVLADIDTVSESYQEDNMSIHRAWTPGISSFFDIVGYVFKNRKNVDVVHLQHEVNLFNSMVVGYLIALLPLFSRRIKRVITSHHAIDYETIDKEFVSNHRQKLPVRAVRIAFKILYGLYRLWDIVIVHEETHRKRLVDQYSLQANKIEVVPHGIEPQQSLDKQTAREQVDVSQYDNVIFYMGYVTGYKDIGVLIEGYALWIKSNPKSILVLGAGPEKKSLDNEEYMLYYQSLQDMAKMLLPEGSYRWLGFIPGDDIPAWYSAADVLVLPYRYTLSASGPMAIAIGYELPFLASECFADYFPDFQECVFEMSAEGVEQGISRFYQNKELFDTTIKKYKEERTYKNCMNKNFELYR